ncbi:MAG: family efflux transporter, partial [Pseudomonas orientalis]|nr:family efflux transporter [Pseudomonas orientalis]
MNTATAPLTRPARIRREVRGLLTLAVPIIIGQLATTAMSFVDAVMAGRVSPKDLAAVGLGNSIWIPVYLLMTGTLLATTPKVAQRYGAGKFNEIGPLVRQSLWLAVVVGLCGALLLLCAEPILHAMKVEPDLIEPSMGYLYGIAAGMPAIALYYVFR